MDDRSNIRQNWYSIGTLTPTSMGLVVLDILVRWNERITTKKSDIGEETEYLYDAMRCDLMPPNGIKIEEYLEKIKADLLQKVQGGKISGSVPINSGERLKILESEAKSMKSVTIKKIPADSG